jgi:hypothetical protein
MLMAAENIRRIVTAAVNISHKINKLIQAADLNGGTAVRRPPSAGILS